TAGADARLAEKPLEPGVVLGAGAREADQQELAEPGLGRGEAHELEWRIRAAADGGENKKASSDGPRQRAAPPGRDRRGFSRLLGTSRRCRRSRRLPRTGGRRPSRQ